MPDVKYQIFKPNFSKELNIESIITAPLVAASKANIIMVTGQTRFLLENCFTKNEKTNTHEPVMIEMSLTKAIIDHEKQVGDQDYVRKQMLTFSMPLLCLVPLNSLVIDKVNIDFDLEITSATSTERDKELKPSETNDQKILDKKAQLNGRISYSANESYSDSNKNKSQLTSRLKVNINAGPLPLPLGVLAIIDMYTKAIQPIAVETITKN